MVKMTDKYKYKVTIITPTTGDKNLYKAMQSVANQTVPCKHLVVIDGDKFIATAKKQIAFFSNVSVIELPENTGVWNGRLWYGHRIYSGVSFLINTDYVAFLDEDNYFDPFFVETMLNALESGKDKWVATCRRHIINEAGDYMGIDDFESIGKNKFGYYLNDTSTYMFKTKAFCRFFSKHLYNTFGADKALSESVNALSMVHVDVEKPLLYYRSPERLYRFFNENIGINE